MPYFVTEDNCKLYYEEHGSGKPVIFIHGWGCNRHYFKKQYPAFEQHFKVLRYDQRGHGDSDRPEQGLTIPQLAKDLRQLIEFCGYEDVTLIGWSMGFTVLCEYLRTYGYDRVSKAVIIDMTVKEMVDEDEGWPHLMDGKFNRKDCLDYLVYLLTDFDSAAKEFIDVMFGDGPCQEEKPWVLREVNKNTLHTMIHLWCSLTSMDFRDFVSTIPIPCFYAHGAVKSMYSPEYAQWLTSQIPNCREESFNGGHILFLQDAEHFNRSVIDFNAEPV